MKNANIIRLVPRKGTQAPGVTCRVLAFKPRQPSLTERIRNDYNPFPVGRAS